MKKKLNLKIPNYPLKSIEYKSSNPKGSISFEEFSRIYLRTGIEERKKSDFDKKGFVFRINDPKTYEFKSVFLDKYGILYSDQHDPIRESLNTYEDFDGILDRLGLKNFDECKNIDLEKSPILFFDHYFCNITHFMTESFPRLFLVRDLLKNGHKIIVPPKADLEKYPYIKSCLSSLSITEEDMIEIPESGAKFSNLIMPSHVKFHPDVVIPAITYLKNHFYDPDIIFNHAGVYISREKARVRGCSNEKEVELICKYFGFKKIIMEDLSLEEKINIMSRTNILVSIDGSAIINSVFMPERSSTLALRPFFFPNFSIFLASLFNQKLWFQICDFSTDDKSWYSGSLLVDPLILFDKISDLEKNPEKRVVKRRFFRIFLKTYLCPRMFLLFLLKILRLYPFPIKKLRRTKKLGLDFIRYLRKKFIT